MLRLKKVTSGQIHHPRYHFIRAVGVKRKFNVIETERNQFFDFTSADNKLFLWKKVDDDRQKYCWADIKWLRFTKAFGSLHTQLAIAIHQSGLLT